MTKHTELKYNLLVVFCILIGTLGFWYYDQMRYSPELSSGVASAPESPTPLSLPQAINYFGIHTDSLDEQGGIEVAYTGADIVRTDAFAWDLVEPEQGVYDFSVPDAAVSWARQNQLDLLGILLYTPPWASGLAFTSVPKEKADCGIPPEEKRNRTADEYRVYPPKNPDDFAEFAAKMVQRYPDVRFWQIWNEPNNPIFWKQKPNANEYAALLKSSYRAIKQTNPDARVVLAGITPSDTQYLTNLFRADIENHFDIMAVHPYNPTKSPNSYLRTEMLKTKALMKNYGISNKSIWITEVGWPTSFTPPGIDEETQAEYVKQLYNIAGALDFVGAVFWHALEDCTVDYDPTELEQNFGLFRHDQTPKPAAEAYRELTR